MSNTPEATATAEHGSAKSYILLFVLALAPRLYLLRVFGIELSNDGFDAVRTLTIVQTSGMGALPRDLVDRFILHPLYMALLGVLRAVTPTSLDFFLVARLLSALLGCLAVLVMFVLVRSALDEVSAWGAALLLAYAPTFLWESVAILSSTLFLTLYLLVILSLWRKSYRWASLLAALSALTRYEGIVLLLLVTLALAARGVRGRRALRGDWAFHAAMVLAFPAAILCAGYLATGDFTQAVGAQSMASIWLRFFAPSEFLQRASFFLTRYSSLFPNVVVWLGVLGCVVTARRQPRFFALLALASALYLLFFEALVWLNYTTLEVRFLMYPGLPLLPFAGAALSAAGSLFSSLWLLRPWERWRRFVVAASLLALLVVSYRQSIPGIRFVYTMHATQEQVATELSRFVPARQKTQVMIYAGVSGALDMFARQRDLDLSFSFFRFVPDGQVEQFLIDKQVQFMIYPVGNAFASAKYPYLSRAEEQDRGGVHFAPLAQFTTQPDGQVYVIWRVTPIADGSNSAPGS